MSISIIIEKNISTSKIKVIVYEKDENQNILSEGMTEIDFDTDLTLKAKSQEKLNQIKINDIKLSYNINKTEVEEQITENRANFIFMKEYKSQKYHIGNMSINSYINKLNITDLNTLASDYLKVQSCYLGDSSQIELNKEYEIEVLEEKDLKENNIVPLISCKLTHDELIRIKNGEKLEKDGITITNDNLWAESLKHTEIINININGIEAVTWIQEDAMHGITRQYMFLVNKYINIYIYIYMISGPSDFECQELINDIVYSITLK